MTTSPHVPLLAAGDKLTRAEFERRYAAMPQLRKAELVEGVVYTSPTVNYVFHAAPHAVLAAWLDAYASATPGLECSSDATLRLDGDNEPQPDLLLRIATDAGSSRIDRDGYLQGPPELVVEIAASSTSYDLHQKRHVYRRSGVREYLVVRPADSAVDWFVLRDDDYQRLVPDDRGFFRSEVFPGLWLDVAALLAGDSAALRNAVQHGIATPAHAAFCRQLQS